MKKDNKALYESIMRKVSKVVKDALNEHGQAPKTEPTFVIFRKEENGDILAVFPDGLWNKQGDITCYAHMGQHTSCDLGYVFGQTTSATPEEYAELKDELENQVGYVLNVMEDDYYWVHIGDGGNVELVIPMEWCSTKNPVCRRQLEKLSDEKIAEIIDSYGDQLSTGDREEDEATLLEIACQDIDEGYGEKID